MFGINKDILWIAGGQIVGVLNNFLVLKMLTSGLSMSTYGYYTLWISIMLFIRQIVYDPISIIAAKESKSGVFLGVDGVSSFQIIKYVTDKLSVGLLIIGLAAIFLEYLTLNKIAGSVYILLGMVYLFSNGAQGIYLNILNILRRRKWAAIGVAADSFVKMVLVYLFFLLFESSLISAIQAVAIGSFIVFIWVRNISKKFYNPLPISSMYRLGVTKKMLMLSLPLFAPTLLTALKGLGDKVFMASFIGVKELAAYNVLLQLGFIPMILIFGVIQTYVSPNIYNLSTGENDDQKKTISYANIIASKIFVMSIVAILLSFFLSDLIFKNLVGVEYFSYSKLLPYFVMAGALSAITGLLNVAVIGVFKPKHVGALMFASITVGLIIVMISIVMYGFEGGIAGLVLSNTMMMLIYGCALRWMSVKT